MDKNHDPKRIEEHWYARWLAADAFHGEPSNGGEPYCIVIPPPNVTGVLHMGHALNVTLQDILARRHRMLGRNVVWLPGTDHAGIATQNVVERALKNEGISRAALGREAFLERVWAWRETYGGTIVKQLKKLGASCDWERERFTMDEGLSRAVTEVFVRLYEKKLIYRGNYIVNWCPRCHTALSDEESEHRETDGKLYCLRYPIAGGSEGECIVVATTRPETLLGDTAVAVNPNDTRYAHLAGKFAILPALNRALPIIVDEYVDAAFGTGAVKVTPAHDPNDFEIGRRHKLEPIDVMNGDGTMNANAGPYVGLDRFECRRRLMDDLEAAGLVEKVEPHRHAVGHCYRCDDVVEPRLSPQWFVSMRPLAEPALKVVEDGRVSFVPKRWENVYAEWMRNIRDWCISRQIWWGHRIPVFYCDACGAEWADRGAPAACPKCNASTIRQDEDVLDTWFSSWLWPFSAFGWPDKNESLDFYYPTHALATAPDIIFFWVARMIMAGLEFMGDVPFRTVYIHGTVRSDDGRKMSKSLGNSIDPLEIIEQYSADALRFSLIMLTATGQDVFVSAKKFEIGRNFGTKLWNVARFIQIHSEAAGWTPPKVGNVGFDASDLRPDDMHILAKLDETIRLCSDNLDRYRFNDAALALYDFVWSQYCDRYTEYAKEPLGGADAARRDMTLGIMHYVFETTLRLLHPFIPFLTEELWHAMGYGGDERLIMNAAWPVVVGEARLSDWGVDAAKVRYVERKHEFIRMVRQIRADFNIEPGAEIEVLVKPEDQAAAAWLLADAESLRRLVKASKLTVNPALRPPKRTPCALTPLGQAYIPLEGLVDLERQRIRLVEQVAKIEERLAAVERKLGNETFVTRAPEEVVAQQRELRSDLLEQIDKLRKRMVMFEET